MSGDSSRAQTAQRVLMVAYHFPPLAGSSGIQRTLRFVQHLPAFGWQPIVLSASPRAYERTSTDLDAEVPAGTIVQRAFALDTARHLALKGRYIGAMARPDRWASWKYDAIRQGLQMIRKHRPAVIWSTYPIATAHVIGAELHRRTGIPWIADFRDPMAQDGYPADPLTWAQYQAIEQGALENAALSVFTTPGAARVYRERYPACAGRVDVIENGFDEESFAGVEGRGAARPTAAAGPIVLLHSGIIYPEERDPTHLIEALKLLVDAGRLKPGQLLVRFRAPVHDALLRDLAAAAGVSAFVETCPPIPYQAALAEMLAADALLVIQASSCNEQIPAKIYEYLRAGRPILCLSDPLGDTIGVMRRAGLDSSASLASVSEIAQLLQRLLDGSLTNQLPDPAQVGASSRKGRTAALAAQLRRVVDEHAAAVSGTSP